MRQDARTESRATSYGASEAAYAESSRMSSSVSLATLARDSAIGFESALRPVGGGGAVITARRCKAAGAYVAAFLRRMIQWGHFAVSR